MRNIKLHIILVITLLISFSGLANDYDYIKSVNSTDINVVAQKITSTSNSEEEKVRAIVHWIKSNIAYDYELAACEGCDRTYVDRYSYVFKYRKGVCSGYSELFYHLAKLNNIEVYTVNGNVSYSSSIHAWNIAKVNNKYIFIDATNKVITYDYNEFKKKYTVGIYYFDYQQSDEKEAYRKNGFYLNHTFPDDDLLNSNHTIQQYMKIKGYTVVSKSSMHEFEETIKLRPLHNYLKSFDDTNTTVVKETKVETRTEVKPTTDSNVIVTPEVLTMSKTEFKSKSVYSLYKYRDDLATYVQNYYNELGSTSLGIYNAKRVRNSKSNDYMKVVKEYRKKFELY